MRSKYLMTTVMSLLFMAGWAGLAWAAGGGGGHEADSGALLKDFLYRVLNFSIVVALLVYFLRKPLKKGLSGRREDIEKELEEARKAREEAEAKFAEYDRKLSEASQEIGEISAAIRREGELEQQKIIENARQTAAKIEADAEKSAELEIARARQQLQQEAARLAVQLAEELLEKNFTRDDDKRLIDEYMQKVGELH